MSNRLLALISAIFMVCSLPSPRSVAGNQQGDQAGGGGSDRVYKLDEIGEKAVIDRKTLDNPSSMGCRQASGTARVLVVLRKTGQVTDAVLRTESGCRDFDRRAVNAALRVKFKPAIKDGQPVSQRWAFEFHFTVRG